MHVNVSLFFFLAVYVSVLNPKKKKKMFRVVSLLRYSHLLLQAKAAIRQMYTHMHHLNSIPFGDKSIPTSIIQHNITLQNSTTAKGKRNIKM